MSLHRPAIARAVIGLILLVGFMLMLMFFGLGGTETQPMP